MGDEATRVVNVGAGVCTAVVLLQKDPPHDLLIGTCRHICNLTIVKELWPFVAKTSGYLVKKSIDTIAYW